MQWQLHSMTFVETKSWGTDCQIEYKEISVFQVLPIGYVAKIHTKLTQTEMERSRLPIAQHVYGTACATKNTFHINADLTA